MSTTLAFKHASGASPGVLFFPGFHSTMQGNKALMLQAYCERVGHQFTRFDYSGHGESPGRFEEGSITQWRDDALSILDTVCQGPQILLGSSMGAWLATLVAMARPERTHAVLCVAAAPDFTTELLLPALNERQHRALMNGETLELDNHYENVEPHRIRQQLIDTGKQHSVLNRPLNIQCPVRLLHGTADTDVPWSLSQRLLDKMSSKNAMLTLVSGANHRFSNDEELRLIQSVLAELLSL